MDKKRCLAGSSNIWEKLWIQWKIFYNTSIWCWNTWKNLVLEASSRGLVAHGMQGFDYEKARISLEIPDNFDVMAMIATGKKGLRKMFHYNCNKKKIQMIEHHKGNNYGRHI